MTFLHPGNRILKKMGYLKDQKGIMERYMMEGDNWNSHLKNSRQQVAEFVKQTKPDELFVLGSGWLLDFPLEEVYGMCQKIHLLDIYHPPQIRKKVEKFPGVRCELADLTGGMVEEAFRNRRLPENRSANPTGLFQSDGKTQGVISLNILNQLDILLIDAVKRSDKGMTKISEEKISKCREMIQRDHLEVLSGSLYCLITDTTELIINSDGKVVEKKPLIFTELPEGSGQRSWKWSFDSHFSYNRGFNTHLDVISRFVNIQ